MPIPALAWAVGALVVALAGGSIWLYAGAKNKSIVLLGERRSGKSTFYSYLQSGVIPKGYTPTLEGATFEKKVNFADYKLNLKVTDLSGAKSEWATWRRLAETAHLVCFMVSWEQLVDDKGYDRIRRTSKQVGSWKVGATTMLVVTFLDRADLDAADVISHERVRAIRQHLHAARAVAVDQTDEDSRHHLGVQTLEVLG